MKPKQIFLLQFFSHPNSYLKLLFLILPAGLWLIAFMLLPIFIILVYSFGSRSDLGIFIPGFNLDNYQRFFQGPYLNCFYRSLSLSTLTTVICLLLAFPTALCLAFNIPNKFKNIAVLLFSIPLSISFLLRIYAWITILRPTGFVCSLFNTFELFPLSLTNSITNIFLYNQAAVLMGMVYNYLPYMIMPLYTSLEKLDTRFIEAAYDLGASPLSTFFRVLVPLSSKAIVAGVILVFVPSLGDYVTPDLLGGAKNMYIGNLIQNQYLAVQDWAFGSAISTILLFLVTGALFCYFKYGEKSALL